MRFIASVGTETRLVEVSGGHGRFRLTMDDQVWDVDARLTERGIVSLLIEGASYDVDVGDADGRYVVEVGGERYEVGVEEESRYIIRTRGGAAEGERGQVVKAPMPGRVTHVAVAIGDTVTAGTPLLVIEAMKMENEFRASGPGTVREVRAQPGQAVNAGDILMVIA